jgi:hypothetical protein
MINTPSSSDLSSGGSNPPTKTPPVTPPASKKVKKSFPPPDAATKPFLVGDYVDIPIDVDLTRMEFASADDPGFFFVYAADAEIHAALGIAGAPVAPGATPALSAAAFRAFVVSEFAAVCNLGNCAVARLPPGIGNSDAAFSKLTNHESETLSNRCLHTYDQWAINVRATAGAATGHAYYMTPSPGPGRSPQAIETRRLNYFAPS